MKKIFKYSISKVAVVAFLLLAASCNDVLDTTPLDTLDPENYFRDETEIRTAVVGIYNTLDMDLFLRLSRYTDNAYGFKDNTANNLLSGEGTAFEEDVFTRWKTDYFALGRANLLINNIDASEVDNDISDVYKGEALFLRAFYYFDLTMLFGDVPLVLDAPSISGDIMVSRASRAEVINQVLVDLDQAVALLPEANQDGRVAKGAALAMKAKVLLFKNDFQGAASAAKAVMDLGIYGLFPDYKTLFWEENEDNEEVIFSIKYMQGFHINLLNKRLVNSSRYAVTLSMLEEYEMANGSFINDASSGYDPNDPFANRDPRIGMAILAPGGVQEGLFDEDGNPQVWLPTDKVKTSIRINKFVQWDLGDWETYDGQDWVMIRYADVLLMYAEAMNETQSLPTQEIYDVINSIRERSGMPDLPTGLTQEEMRKRIRHERRVELAFEGHRLYDIIRWQIGDEAFNEDARGYDQKKLKDPSDPSKWQYKEKVIAERNWNVTKGYLWPIPGIERDTNPNLTQNAGY